MKKGTKSGREPDSNPTSIRNRIQVLLKEKELRQNTAPAKQKKGNSVPRAVSSARTKDEPAIPPPPLHIALEDSFSTSISPLNRSFTPKSRPIPKPHTGAVTVKSVNRSFNFAAKRVNLRISPDKKAVLPLPMDSDLEFSQSEKETIVSVLNSTVPSPQKTRDTEIEAVLKQVFKRDNLRVVRREVERGRLPRTVLVLQGREWVMYDVVG